MKWEELIAAQDARVCEVNACLAEAVSEENSEELRELAEYIRSVLYDGMEELERFRKESTLPVDIIGDPAGLSVGDVISLEEHITAWKAERGFAP